MDGTPMLGGLVYNDCDNNNNNNNNIIIIIIVLVIITTNTWNVITIIAISHKNN